MAVQTVVRWDQIISQCGGYREEFVRVFREYEGQATDERDAQGRVVKVTVASFARHLGVDKSTLGRWIKEVELQNATPAPAKGTKLRTKGTNGVARSNGSRTVKKQAQRSVNTTDEDWDEFKIIAEDIGTTAAEELGRLVEDRVRVNRTHRTTPEERAAKAEPIIDACGVDDSFNEAIEIVTGWLDSLVSTVQNEDEKKVLARLLKRKLNQLEHIDLKKQKVHIGPRLEGINR